MLLRIYSEVMFAVVFFSMVIVSASAMCVNAKSGALAHDYSLRLADNQIIPLFESHEKFASKLSSYGEYLEGIAMAQEVVDEVSTEVITKDGVRIPVRLYDSGSPWVIVLGLGMGTCASQYERFVKALTPHYSVVAFSYEWHCYAKPAWATIPFTIGKTFFERNHEDVIAVTEWARSIVGDKKMVVGLGECYSAFNFAKAQAVCCCRGKRLFDKLILDSAFYSLEAFAEAIVKDPWLQCNPFEGGCPQFIQSILGSRVISKPCVKLLGGVLPDVSIEPYLHQLRELPVLFIRGQHDTFVLPKYFEKIWAAIDHCQNKAIFYTPFNHSNSFEYHKARKQYRFVMDEFIRQDFESFVNGVSGV